MHSRPQWNINTVPGLFWSRIEAAKLNAERFTESLQALSAGELREVFAQFRGLAMSAIERGFKSFPEEVQEEAMESLTEMASWVITQGRARYEEILEHPERFPKRREIGRPIFAGLVIAEYTRRFGPWRSEDD
jgi:hypothetical protein